MEAALDAALHKVDLLEVRQELLGLAPVDLAVLRRLAAQVVVQLDRLVRGRAVLVLRRLVADPKVDVVPGERRGAQGWSARRTASRLRRKGAGRAYRRVGESGLGL